MSDTDEQSQGKAEVKVQYDPNKVVPKLVTTVGIAKSTTGNMIVSLICDLPGEPAHIVERIVVDSQTADEFIRVLTEAKGAKDAE